MYPQYISVEQLLNPQVARSYHHYFARKLRIWPASFVCKATAANGERMWQPLAL